MNKDAIESAFAANFLEHEELGASISIWENGQSVMELASGFTSKDKSRVWDEEIFVPVYSATKAPAAITLLWLLEKHGLTPNTKVAQVWSKFPNKEADFSQLLSHQCGLSALDTIAAIDDYTAVIAAIESQKPQWELGNNERHKHGYHPRTYGFLLDEAARQLSGERIGSLWNREIAKPLNLEFYIGIPDSLSINEIAARIAPLYPGKAKASLFKEDPFYSKLADLTSLTGLSFASPRGINSVLEMNQPKVWELALPSMGGIGTARALAKFYQATLGFQEEEILSARVRDWFTQSQVCGHDQVLQQVTHFGMGCMINQGFEPAPFGASPRAYGHPGAGGSVAYADPDRGISFAYTMNQMTLSVLPNEKSQAIIKLL